MAAQRISVPDVSRDILFAGTPAGAALAAAGVRAVQSTPLVGSGEVLGMLSTHYAAPHELTENDEDMLDHIAHRAVFWLEGGAL
jgi:GAF domain-containing protein